MRSPKVVAVVLSLTAILATGAVAEGATVHSNGTATVANGKWFDLDAGVVLPRYGGDDDFYFGWEIDGPLLAPINPARLLKMGFTRPSYSTCRSAQYKLRNYGFWQLPQGTWLCARTDEGRFARLKVLNDPDSGDCCAAFRLRWTTWD